LFLALPRRKIPDVLPHQREVLRRYGSDALNLSDEPFENAKQRIYMSATLGAGGDLERLMGRSSITRLPVPEGWDKQGVAQGIFRTW
jgi:hypothetical protein